MVTTLLNTYFGMSRAWEGLPQQGAPSSSLFLESRKHLRRTSELGRCLHVDVPSPSASFQQDPLNSQVLSLVDTAGSTLRCYFLTLSVPSSDVGFVPPAACQACNIQSHGFKCQCCHQNKGAKGRLLTLFGHNLQHFSLSFNILMLPGDTYAQKQCHQVQRFREICLSSDQQPLGPRAMSDTATPTWVGWFPSLSLGPCLIR